MSDVDSPDHSYRPDLHLFVVRWPTHEHLATARHHYEALLLLPEARRTARWLFDVRRRPRTSTTNAQWIIGDWLPQAAALVPTPLRLAYLVAPTRAEELTADTPLRAVVEPATRSDRAYQMNFFTDEGAAVAWLLG